MLSFAMALGATTSFAAGNTLIPGDTNSRIAVENAVVKGNETTVFFYTYPDRGDPNSGKSCPLNYYSARFEPGLPTTRADVVAKGVCGAGLFQKSRLLESGDALIIVRDRLERWRAGTQINSKTFSSMDAVSRLGVTTDMTGGQFYDISPDGNVVLLIQSGGNTYDRNEYRDSSMVMSSLNPDGGLRWEERFIGDPTLTTVKRVWAAPGGSALLNFSSMANGLSDEATQLHFISANGTKTLFELNKVRTAFDLEKFSNSSQQNMSHEEVMKQLAEQNDSTSESIGRLEAVAKIDGGFDVLFHREGGAKGREGYFLYRIGPDGILRSEISLGNQISAHGLERWLDFYVDEEQLVLLSSAAVTQKTVGRVKKKWGQNIVSWVDLDTGTPTPRMIPLDERYLEAAMTAGDEGRQYLDGLPGGEPELLTTLGGEPLVVSVGWISHRQVLRLNEADEHLMAFTEAYDETQARHSKEASRKQRKVDREARMQRMNVAEAEAAGMTPEAYNALSNREQKEALVRSGGFDKLMETMTQESQLANDPNMTPEMRAQMAAIMAQMGQGPGGQGVASPAMPENALKVDAGKRGFIEYKNKDGRLITLLIFDRQTGKELLKKDYPDGVIYEYVDFSRFNLPLEQIGVIYREVAGMILEDLTPVISQLE